MATRQANPVLKHIRVLTGVVGPQAGRTQTECVLLERSDVDAVRPTALSLMPDGLLAALRDGQVRDLIGYLMARAQVPLPAGAKE